MMPLNDLDWRDIPGYNGVYQISRMGEVRSWNHGRWPGLAPKPKLLRPFIHRHNIHGSAKKWYAVKLTTVDGKAVNVPVHILMRDTWLGGPRPGMMLCHKNGDLSDNCLHNLVFMTKADVGKRFGCTSRRTPVVKVAPDGEIVACYPSVRAAARANHMSYQTIIDRCKGKVKNPFALDGHTYAYDI